ncbi:hypothetical protein NP493_913g02037 [Ridgeia piscesae]|uniref:GYF domain-containing protein n=1 Tax=Ridgeia piscesae TaxID=27915 RepID=A0AAD9NJU5_RIDPI|nr:hypothetical protein NP493_913g02037 [Ridgeia piscesae]
MSKRKVQFADKADDNLEQAFEEVDADATKKRRLPERESRFKEKHSLDSDEEDIPEKYNVLDEDDIEGQEETHIEVEEGVKFTPFNMKEELEEGHFDSEGTYIFSKDKDNIKDNWIDSIDWVQVKQTTKDSGGTADDEDDDDDDEPSKDSGDRLHVYNEMLKLMKPGESVLKSLRRLGGGKAGMAAASASRRWKEKRAAAQGGNKSTSAPEVNRTDLLALTGHADRQLQQGNLEIYQATYEKLAFDVSEMEKANADAEAERRTVIPQGIEDDDALDMFADSFDTKGDTKGDAVSKEKDATEQTQNDAKKEEKTPAVTVKVTDEAMWEYKWKQEDTDIHGPFSSSEMLAWTNEDFFKAGVLVRKVGSSGDFYSSTRIDFDLYT